MSKSSDSLCEVDGSVSRRLVVHLSSCTHGFCVAPAPVQQCSPARAVHGYCDHRVCARLLGFSVACDGIRAGHLVRGQTVCCPIYICSAFRHVPLHAGVWSNVLLVQQGVGSSHEATHEEQLLWVEQAGHPWLHSDYDDPVSGRTASQLARPRTMRR